MRLRGTAGNRDAIGARVTVETDRVRRSEIVQAGSGFLSQHSKELLFGLGASERILKMTVSWPSGKTQTFTDVPLNARLRIVEGSEIETEALKPRSAAKTTSPVLAPASAPLTTWMYEPFPAPDFSLQDLAGGTRSLAALRGKPAIVLLWSFDVAAARAALETLGAWRRGVDSGRRGVDRHCRRSSTGSGIASNAVVRRHAGSRRHP